MNLYVLLVGDLQHSQLISRKFEESTHNALFDGQKLNY